MVIRVAPPSMAAAPTMAYACRSTPMSEPSAASARSTASPQICPSAAPTARLGTKSPEGAAMP